MQTLFAWMAVSLYGIGLGLALPAVMRRRLSIAPTALTALGFGLVAHCASLVAAGMESHRLPVTDVRSALSFFAFLVTLAFFLVYMRYRIASLGIFMLPLVFVLTLISALRAGASFRSPTFRGGWLFVHIASIFLGYTGFSLTFVAALMYLIQESQLKSKKLRAIYYRLPPLEVCDELYYRSLLFGLPFLTLGILTGFVWASRTWRGPWEFDPKIMAAMITWLIYLVLFSTRLSGAWRGRRGAYVAIFGFAAIMVTFLGASLLSGQHGFVPKLGNLP
jgi:cytochrome c-type biogenesis protein CcsB